MYIDPGVGSIIIQFLIGIAVLIPVGIGIFWGKLKKLFRGKHGNKGK